MRFHGGIELVEDHPKGMHRRGSQCALARQFIRQRRDQPRGVIHQVQERIRSHLRKHRRERVQFGLRAQSVVDAQQDGVADEWSEDVAHALRAAGCLRGRGIVVSRRRTFASWRHRADAAQRLLQVEAAQPITTVGESTDADGIWASRRCRGHLAEHAQDAHVSLCAKRSRESVHLVIGDRHVECAAEVGQRRTDRLAAGGRDRWQLGHADLLGVRGLWGCDERGIVARSRGRIWDTNGHAHFRAAFH